MDPSSLTIDKFEVKAKKKNIVLLKRYVHIKKKKKLWSKIFRLKIF